MPGPVLLPYPGSPPRLRGRQILGLGTDILSVDRMRGCVDSRAFVRRTFTDAEMHAGASRADPDRYYALVFAGKEAVFKCLGVEAQALRSWQDIEIVESGEAPPGVNLSGSMAEIAAARGVEQVLLSLSCDADYATAVAALVGEARHVD